MSIKIINVKRKGSLMILTVETDIMTTDNAVEPPVTRPEAFNLEIDADINEEELWSHINSHYALLKETKSNPITDKELEKKWKGKTRETTKNA